MNAEVRFTQRDPVTVAHVTGEIDVDNVEGVAVELRHGISNDAAGLVLDCSEVRYIDSAGVRMLFELARQLTSTRREFLLAVPTTSPLRRLFAVTHMDAAAPVCATVEDAVARLSSPNATTIR